MDIDYGWMMAKFAVESRWVGTLGSGQNVRPRVCWRLRPHNFFAFSSSLQENHNTMRRATVIATKSAASPAAVAVQARALAQSQRLYATAVRVAHSFHSPHFDLLPDQRSILVSTLVLRCDTKCCQNEILSLCADRLQSRLAAQFTELEGQVQRDRPQGAGSRQEAQDRAWRSSSWSGHAQHGKRSCPTRRSGYLI